MTPEQRGNPAENSADDVPASLLANLRASNWSEAIGPHDDAWLREKGSVPAVREAAAVGIIRSIGTGQWTQGLRIRDLLALGPDSFASDATGDLIEEGIAKVLSRNEYATGLFAELTQLPIPTDFYRRERVRSAAIHIQARALGDGKPDAIDIIRKTGTDDVMFVDETMRIRAIQGISLAAWSGNAETVLRYAEAFKIDTATIGATSFLNGFDVLLSKGELDRAIAFARQFPQITDAWHQNPRTLLKIEQGIHNLILHDEFAEAERLAKFGEISPESMDPIIQKCVREFLRHEKEPALRALLERWDVSSETIRSIGSNIVTDVFSQHRTYNVPTQFGEDLGYGMVRNSQKTNYLREILTDLPQVWKSARQIQALARLPEEQFERDVIRGMTLRVGKNAIPITTREEIEQIRDVRNFLPIDAEFADRLERECAVALIRHLFRKELGDEISDVRTAFPFVDVATVRQAALDEVRQQVENFVNGKTGSLDPICATNRWLLRRDMEPIGWSEIPEKTSALAFGLLETMQASEYIRFAESMQIPAQEQTRILEESRSYVRGILLNAYHDDDERKLMFDLCAFDWNEFPFASIPLKYLIETTDEKLLAYAKNDPWHAALGALLRLQGRSANEEHDPWENELFPLVNQLRQTNAIDRESAADGGLLVEFVKTFGMLNLPNVARIFLGLRRKKFALLPEDDQALLVELVGQKATRLDSANLINEMRKLRFDLQRELLLDRIPHRIGTTLGGEIFLTLRGSTKWEHNDDTEALMETWKETVAAARAEIVRLEGNAVMAIASGNEEEAARLYERADKEREKISVARGYEETTFAVPRIYRGKDATAGAEKGAEKEIEALVRLAGMSDANRALDNASGTARLARNAKEDSERFRDELVCPYGGQDKLAMPELSDIESLFKERDDRAFVAYMETIAATDSAKGLELLNDLSAAHLSVMAPSHWVDQLVVHHFQITEAEILQRAEFVESYLKEHYLNPAQDPAHVGHAPFSETLRLALERAWCAEGDASTNAMMKARADIAAIRARRTFTSRESLDVTLVPVQGPLRVYAGDIGDACYTSQHGAMARGEFSNVRAMIFVTNRGKGTERMAGSVLLVETRTHASNERVLVIRANNPRQNLIAQLDAPSLVTRTIDAAIATARRRGIKHVAVVRDRATAASSNREEVAQAYHDAYEGAPPVRLKNEPATNFNGYNVWDTDEGHPSVIVWTNDDPEAT